MQRPSLCITADGKQKRFDCVRQNALYLRHFSVRQVLRCPAGTDPGCQIISGFGHHLELTDRLALDLMLVSIRCHGEFQKYEVMTLSLMGGQAEKKKKPKQNKTKTRNPSSKAAKQIERTFLISDCSQYNRTLFLPFITDFMSLLASIWCKATRSSDGLRGLVADTLESPAARNEDQKTFATANATATSPGFKKGAALTTGILEHFLSCKIKRKVFRPIRMRCYSKPHS